MDVAPTPLADALVLTPTVYADDRGFVYESWNGSTLADEAGLDAMFVQDNHSRSTKGVLRGLHYQHPVAQGKLVWCAVGSIWDVIVDLRSSSPSFRKWYGVELSDSNHLQLWVPPGFAHGFLALTDTDVMYKTTEPYRPEAERGFRWDDPEVGIEWPLDGAMPILSERDAAAPPLSECPLFD